MQIETPSELRCAVASPQWLQDEALYHHKPPPNIAEDLHIVRKTVEKHRENLKRKLDIHCVAGLTRHAYVKGIIEITSVRNIKPPLQEAKAVFHSFGT